jgi:ubiquinone/menaquinone biosynthesis C-methylase UbiE
MKKETIVSVHNKGANTYDSQVKEYDSYGHDVLFGMCFEFVKANEKMLDFGIGTGLASLHFSKMGLKIYGIDASEEMLNVCRSKSFTEQLLLQDMSDLPIPFDNSFFDHVTCCGVFHFIHDLDRIFCEIKRIIRKNGIFAFTIAPSHVLNCDEDYQDILESPTGWGVSIYKHSQKYLDNLLKRYGFGILKEQRLFFKDAAKKEHNMEFSVLITRSYSGFKMTEKKMNSLNGNIHK